jgi:hypothetical protein
MAKHRSKRANRLVKKASVAGGAAATVTAMTLSLASPASAALLDDQLDVFGLTSPAESIPDIPGVNIITTGSPFGLLSIFGDDPFWVPALPSRIADEINGTPYLPGGDIDIPVTVPNPAYIPSCTDTRICPPKTITGSLDLDLASLRLPVVIAFGLGALATGMAYPQVEDDLPNQPGGTGPNAPPGSSVTIVPMLLVLNPGRNDGGVAARFASLFEILGIDTATNDFEVQTDGNAVLVPVKVDVGLQNDPISDFAAWPNPVTLLNNASALAFPTYIVRGSDLSGVGLQTLNPLVANMVGNFGSAIIGDGLTVDLPGALPNIDLSRAESILTLDPVLTSLLGDTFPGIDIEIPNGPELEDRYEALNQYFTIENGAQPMLEPFRYPTDLLSVLTGQTITNPFADAVEPAITMLGNLGYTNVVQYGADPTDFRDDYQRDFSDNFGGNGGEAMPFFSFPENVKWDAVPADLAKALVGGTQDAFFYGGIPGLNNPPPSYRDNPLALVVDLLEQLVGSINLSSLTDLGPLNDAGDVLAAIDAAGGSAGLRDLGSTTPLAVNAAPDQDAGRMAVNADAPTTSPPSPQGDTTSDGALADSSATTVADDITDTPRPRFKFGRGSINPLTSSDEPSADIGSSGTASIRRAISDTRQQIRDSVRDFTKGVSDATKNITKAATGGGTRADNTDASGDGDSG